MGIIFSGMIYYQKVLCVSFDTISNHVDVEIVETNEMNESNHIELNDLDDTADVIFVVEGNYEIISDI